MRTLDLVQGSDDWLSYRNNSVTATDFAVIAANNGWCENLFKKSVSSLIKNKIEPKKPVDNKFFAMGREWEDTLINHLELSDIVKGEVVTSQWNNRIMASLDARSIESNYVIEVKTTTKPLSALQSLVDYYSYQVAHQCYISNSALGILIIGFVDKDVLCHVEQIEIDPELLLSLDLWLALNEKFLATLDKMSCLYLDNFFKD